MPHGTLTAYVYFKCRCTVCRLYWNAYHRRYRDARRESGKCVRCGEDSKGFARCLACRKYEAKAA